MNKFFGHLWTVTKHRHHVFVLCTRCGLFWRGLVHDLSKFLPTEFFEGVKYFNGHYSPIIECRKQNGYSLAWLHHKGRNKHHFEYWYDDQNPEQVDIPYKYAVESVCDRIAASMTYQGKNFDHTKPYYYWKDKTTKDVLNKHMMAFYDKVFADLKDNGLKYILNKKYMKATYTAIVENYESYTQATQ